MDDAFTTPVDGVGVAKKGVCLPIASATNGASSAAKTPVPKKLTPGQDNFARLYSSSKEHSPPQPLEVDGPKPDLNEIHNLMRKHGFGYIIGEKGTEQGEETHLMVVFLYVRGVHKCDPDMRKSLICKIGVEGSGERQRLEAIMSVQNEDQDPHHEHCPIDWQPKYHSVNPGHPFSTYAQLSSKWNTDPEESQDCFLIFGDSFEPNQAVQCSSYCYLQAAITAHAYAVRWGKTDAGKKVNISQYIRRTFDANRLYKRIKGGSAFDVLKDLSALKTLRNELIEAENVEEDTLFQCLRDWGAGLVTQFHVDKKFQAPNRLSYDGRITIEPNKKSGHAMVLVGARKEGDGKCWLLLQNWWKGKQFVEVTLDYFKTSQSVLYFFTQEHNEVHEPFTVTSHNFTEANYADGGDDDTDTDDGEMNY